MSRKQTRKLKTQDVSPTDGRVTARLAAAGAMLPQLYTVADALRATPDPHALRSAVIEQNLLARSSHAARVKLHKKLQQRYFPPERAEEWPLLIHALQRVTLDDQRALVAYVALNWNDLLFRALNTGWLVGRLNDTGTGVDVDEVLDAIKKLERDHPAIQKWGESTRQSVAQHYLSALRDFGFARGRARKCVARPHVGPDPLLYACEILVVQGMVPRAVIRHEVFRALGLDLDGTVGALSDLDRQGLLGFRTQGGVVYLRLRQRGGGV